MDLKATMGAMTGNASEDLKTLYNYVFQLTEEMRYLMSNLDVTNFNDLGLARYENGRLQVYSEIVEVRASKVESVVEALGEDLGEFETWTEGELTEVRSSITQTAQQIELRVQGVETGLGKIQSTVTQTADSVSAIVSNVGSGGNVTAASIIAAINADESEVKISADKITLEGDVRATSLFSVGTVGNVYNSVEIHNGYISMYAGEIASNNDTFGIFGNDYLRLWASSGVVIVSNNGPVEIYPGGAGGWFWRFTDGEIEWCDMDGEVVKTVAFE